MGFIFDGISSQKMGIDTRMSVEERIPDIRNNTDMVAGRNGVVDFGQTLGERKIEISCFIPPGNSEKSLLSLKDDIVSWLNPEKGLCELILDNQPGRKYYARLEDGVSFERLVRTTGIFDLVFFCPDPFAYAVEDEVFKISGSQNVHRKNGNVSSHPIFEIKGELATKEDTISVSVNGEKFTVQGPLKKSETFVVNTDNMTAQIVSSGGEIKNGLGHLVQLVFPYLKTGDNMITVGTDGGSLSMITLHAKSRWL